MIQGNRHTQTAIKIGTYAGGTFRSVGPMAIGPPRTALTGVRSL